MTVPVTSNSNPWSQESMALNIYNESSHGAPNLRIRETGYAICGAHSNIYNESSHGAPNPIRNYRPQYALLTIEQQYGKEPPYPNSVF